MFYLIKLIWPAEEISASLNDCDEGNEKNGEKLKHGSDLANPGREVEVAGVRGPVEHLGEVASLERHDAQDYQTHGQ